MLMMMLTNVEDDVDDDSDVADDDGDGDDDDKDDDGDDDDDDKDDDGDDDDDEDGGDGDDDEEDGDGDDDDDDGGDDDDDDDAGGGGGDDERNMMRLMWKRRKMMRLRRETRFGQACAGDMRMEISQEPFRTENLQAKWARSLPETSFCVSLRNRNAHGTECKSICMEIWRKNGWGLQGHRFVRACVSRNAHEHFFHRNSCLNFPNYVMFGFICLIVIHFVFFSLLQLRLFKLCVSFVFIFRPAWPQQHLM